MGTMKEILSILKTRRGEPVLKITDANTLTDCASAVIQQILLEHKEEDIHFIYDFFREVAAGLIALADNPADLMTEFTQRVMDKKDAFEKVKGNKAAALIALNQKIRS